MDEIKFLVDENLLGLLRKLRMLGFDSISLLSSPDKKLLELAVHEGRVLLTQDLELSQLPHPGEIYLVKAISPKEQLVEVLGHFQLHAFPNALTRCTECNHLLYSVEKSALAGHIPEKTFKYYDEFFACKRCERIYWKGSHYQNMLHEIENLKVPASFS
jgi:Uncharacterized conserved protein